MTRTSQETSPRAGWAERWIEFSWLAGRTSVEYDFVVSLVTLKAHFDGQHVCLDEPIDLPPNTKLMVTVWLDAKQGAEAERQAWLAASQAWLAGAYGDHEPDYSDTMLREEPRRE